jgi:YD repeat-containing protein
MNSLSKRQKHVTKNNTLVSETTFEYDDIGQLIKVTLPEVNGQSPVYEYTYDSQG